MLNYTYMNRVLTIKENKKTIFMAKIEDMELVEEKFNELLEEGSITSMPRYSSF